MEHIDPESLLVELDIPEPDRLLSAVIGPDEQLRGLAYILYSSDAVIDKIASTGLCARLGAYSSAEPEAMHKLAMNTPTVTPAAKTQRWARRMSAKERKALQVLVTEEVAGWVRYGEELATRGALMDESILLAYWRDRIASAAYILRAAGCYGYAASVRSICMWPDGVSPAIEENGGGLLKLVGQAEPWADWAQYYVQE